MENSRALILVVALLMLSACSSKPALHVVGVYEGSYPPGVSHSFGNHPDGNIDIHVKSSRDPIVLGLASYEPVIWHIHSSERMNFQEIILSGHHPSKVAGVPESVKITRQAFGFSYEANAMNSPYAIKLKDYTGLEVRSFQGMYTGKEFSIH